MQRGLVFTVIQTALLFRHIDATFNFLSLQPIYHWQIGDKIDEGQVLRRNVTQLLAHHSPCSENVWIIAPVVKGEIFLAVSFSGFNHKLFQWYSATEEILQVIVEVVRYATW